MTWLTLVSCPRLELCQCVALSDQTHWRFLSGSDLARSAVSLDCLTRLTWLCVWLCCLTGQSPLWPRVDLVPLIRLQEVLRVHSVRRQHHEPVCVRVRGRACVCV